MPSHSASQPKPHKSCLGRLKCMNVVTTSFDVTQHCTNVDSLARVSAQHSSAHHSTAQLSTAQHSTSQHMHVYTPKMIYHTFCWSIFSFSSGQHCAARCTLNSDCGSKAIVLARNETQKWELFAACLEHLQLVISALQPGMVQAQVGSEAAPPPGLSVMLDLLRKLLWSYLFLDSV